MAGTVLCKCPQLSRNNIAALQSVLRRLDTTWHQQLLLDLVAELVKHQRRRRLTAMRNGSWSI